MKPKLQKKATFSILQYGGGTDESFIRADKEGLKLFALELLKAARKSADVINDTDKNVIPIAFEENWISEQSDTVIQYVEPVAERQPIQAQVKREETFADKLLPVGCIAALIILVVAVFVGLWTIAKSIF